MVHQMKLQQNPFEKIKNGTKTIELRLFDEKRQKLQLGDEIQFCLIDDPETTLNAKIVGLLQYRTFEDLYQDFPPEATGSDTKDDWKLMRKYYSEEDEKKYGVLGIRLEVLS